MKLIKNLLFYIITPILYLFSLIIWHNLLLFKKYLYNRKDNNSIIHRSLVAIYNIRISKKGSYIGYKAILNDIPVFPHGILGVFISDGAIIGRNCVIYHQVTIGSNTLSGNSHFGSPIIGDNVLMGAGAKIIGKVKVGNNVRIGANAVVARDIPDNCVVVSTGRVIQKEETLDNRFYSYRGGSWGYFQNGKFIKDESIILSNSVNNNK